MQLMTVACKNRVTVWKAFDLSTVSAVNSLMDCIQQAREKHETIKV